MNPAQEPDTSGVLYDFAIIGAGMAGASVAHQLAPHAKVIMLERESQPGYHATGRSAAMFMETLGTACVRALTRASRAFYEMPPVGFTDRQLLSKRGVLYIASHAHEDELARRFDLRSKGTTNLRWVTAADATHRVPVLEENLLCGAIFEEGAADIEVHALHQACLKAARASGAALLVNAELVKAGYAADRWNVMLSSGRSIMARNLVNAAGAWVDHVARICGVQPVGIECRRRTAFTFASPEGMNSHDWPLVSGVGAGFYFKPDAGQILGSPANADVVEPHDVVAEELDVALGIHRIEVLTKFRIRRPTSTWAGLRSFVRDEDMVIGWDDANKGFFWLAAQGGYGIQTAPAVSQLAAALLLDQPVPGHLSSHGVMPDDVSPRRLR